MVRQANTVKEVLVAARWMIANVGWCQHVMCEWDTENGWHNGLDSIKPTAFCMIGALTEVVSFPPQLSDNALRLVRSNLPKKFNRSIATFNDDKKTTKRKVLSFLDDLIKKA